jgi:hypothetical protein
MLNSNQFSKILKKVKMIKEDITQGRCYLYPYGTRMAQFRGLVSENADNSAAGPIEVDSTISYEEAIELYNANKTPEDPQGIPAGFLLLSSDKLEMYSNAYTFVKDTSSASVLESVLISLCPHIGQKPNHIG